MAIHRNEHFFGKDFEMCANDTASHIDGIANRAYVCVCVSMRVYVYVYDPECVFVE